MSLGHQRSLVPRVLMRFTSGSLVDGPLSIPTLNPTTSVSPLCQGKVYRGSKRTTHMRLRVLEKCSSSWCVSLSSYLSTQTQLSTKLSYQNHFWVGCETFFKSGWNHCVWRFIDEWHRGTWCLTVLFIVSMLVLPLPGIFDYGHYKNTFASSQLACS